MPHEFNPIETGNDQLKPLADYPGVQKTGYDFVGTDRRERVLYIKVDRPIPAAGDAWLEGLQTLVRKLAAGTSYSRAEIVGSDGKVAHLPLNAAS